MVLHNPNNWHWVDKDVSGWTTEYLTGELVKLAASTADGIEVRVTKVESIEGDADVCQRKGKVITLFDLSVKIQFSGEIGEVKKTGTIFVPEASQDSESLDDLVFEITVDEAEKDASESDKIRAAVRTALRPKIGDVLTGLRGKLISQHGGDIQHGPNDNPSSGFAKARVVERQSAGTGKSAGAGGDDSKTTSSSAAGSINVTKLTDRVELRTTAAEVFATFTTAERLAAFTRAAPKRFDGAVEGGQFELFDGNVTGRFVKLEKPTKIVQTWRLAQWPAGHFSTMTLSLDQRDDDGVTIVDLAWDGMPVGFEDTSMRNWQEYYINSIKRTFGFGTIL